MLYQQVLSLTIKARLGDEVGSQHGGLNLSERDTAMRLLLEDYVDRLGTQARVLNDSGNLNLADAVLKLLLEDYLVRLKNSRDGVPDPVGVAETTKLSE